LEERQSLSKRKSTISLSKKKAFMILKQWFSLLIILLCFLGCKPSEEETFLTVKDHLIHVKKSGSGKPLLLIHGGYLNLDMWEPQVAFFEKAGYLVIRYSDIGHGATKKGEEPLPGHEIIDQIVHTYTDQKIVLAGLSWGAMLAVNYSLHHPDQVESLILVSPGLQDWDYFQDTLAGQYYLARQQCISLKDTSCAINLFHQNWVVGPRRSADALDEEFITTSYGMIKHTMTHHWQSDWSTLDSLGTTEHLSQLKMPTLVVIGEEDVTDMLEVGQIFNRQLPNGHLEQLPGVAHLLTMEDPTTFNKLVLEFLEK
jgi:3-oxoadipate enol-lactonase